MTLREQFYAELYRGYLSLTPEQLAALTEDDAFDLTANAEWPANADVPRLCPHDDTFAELPCLAIVATEGKTKHPMLLSVDVFVRLQIQAQIADGGDEDELAGTPLETAQAWVQAVIEAIHATETFRAHLLALSDAERAGGEIMLRVVDSGVPHVSDAGDRTHTWEIKISHKVDVSPAD